MWRGSIAGVLVAVLALHGRALAAVPAPTPIRAGAVRYVPGEVLVQFRARDAAEEHRAVAASHGHSILADPIHPGWARVAVRPGQTVEEALAAYRSDPAVLRAQPNYVYRIAATPDDPLYGQLWAFKNTGQTITSASTQPPSSPLTYTTNNPGTPGDDIDVERAWDHVTDCSSVVVAVVDSGVNYTQQDLAGSMWDGGAAYPLHGYDYVDVDDDPMDRNGHGTHVAGIIGATGNDARGTTGVCWKASIMAVRVMDATGQGTTATVIQGVTFAVSQGAKVINMSLAGGAFDQLYSDAIGSAQAADVVVVVAAGNDGADNDGGATPKYPCNFTQPNLVCVAALDQSYALATFSNYGTTSVDVGAPGTNVVSTWAGTSAATTDPLTSGWTGSSTTGGGWAYATLGSTQLLVDPSSYPSGLYASGTDDRAYKSFGVPGGDVALVQLFAAIDVANGDYFRVAYAGGSADPFAGTGTVVASATNLATYPSLILVSGDVSSCLGASCTVGFQLQSGAGSAGRGVAITAFSVDTLALNSTSYNTENGTSMATPMVAGLATMLRAYNPQYTFADVVSAIENGGRPTASLAGKTATGNAIDVMGSLAYIHPPTGLAATVQ